MMNSTDTNDCSNGQSSQSCNVQYSMPGILHFLQTEWTKFDMERAQWEVERAEMQARIAFLQGERKAQDNLKRDLVRRIKMLELALTRERNANNALKLGTELADAKADLAGKDDEDSLDSELLPPTTTSSNSEWKQSRQLLRQYLNEIGYTETVINVRSARVRAMLGIQPLDQADDGRPGAASAGKPSSINAMSPAEAILNETEDSIMELDFLRRIDDQDGQDRKHGLAEGGVDATDNVMNDSDTEEALNEFDMILNNAELRDNADMNGAGEATVDEADGAGRPSRSDEWVGADVRKRLGKAAGKRVTAQRPSRQLMRQFMEMAAGHDDDDHELDVDGLSLIDKTGTAAADEQELGELSQLANGPGNTMGESRSSGRQQLDYTDGVAIESDSHKTWEPRYSLRNHFDAVRCVVFHPVEPLLLTASEDQTVKMWNLQKAQQHKKTSSWEVDAGYTFRGHQQPVLCLAVSPKGDQLYSGSLDGRINVWNMPSINIDPYDSFEPSLLRGSIEVHTDAVWALAIHERRGHLLTCSADGLVALIAPGQDGVTSTLLRTYQAPAAEAGGRSVPTSVAFSHSDQSHMCVAYNNGQLLLFDLETGQQVVNFEPNAGTAESPLACQINRVISHPTMAQTVSAHEDRSVRIYDNQSGQMIHRFTPHLDSVSALDIDSQGLYMVSGSHDCTVRIWQYERRHCIQEMTAHRKKLDESIHDVAFHSSKPFLATAGADAVAKVYV